jgi:hypothetical protein
MTPAAVQVLLDDKLAAASKPAVAVGALLFAPPNVGNHAFVAEFNMRVNARRCADAAQLSAQQRGSYAGNLVLCEGRGAGDCKAAHRRCN